MLSSEFGESFKKFPYINQHFVGVFSINTLPKNLKTGDFLVCNTDSSFGSGKHWFCIVKQAAKVLECFDSLGIDDDKKAILKNQLGFKSVKEIKFNVTRVQSLETSSCGHFVLYFVVERFHNKDLSFSELLNSIFVHNVDLNEKTVAEFFVSHF